MTKRNLLLVLLFLNSGIYGQDLKPGNKAFPFSFRENKGQITDQEGKPRKDIDFMLQTPGMSLTVGSAQLHYQFVRREDRSAIDTLGKHRLKLLPKGDNEPKQRGYHTPDLRVYRLDVVLLNANKKARVIKENGREEQYHYYNNKTGNQGITDVRAYEKITYQNIYPHIDWVLYTQGRELKYDFIVHPGGKVSDIKLQYDGADAIAITKDSSLEISTPLSKLTEHAPYAYEKEGEKRITARYKLQGNTAGFTTAPYQGTLVIDPGVDWATYFGSGADEYVTGTACDTSGNVYITGNTYSANGIATIGSHQSTFAGGRIIAGIDTNNNIIYGIGPDGFLAKFDSLGQLKWATYYGGTNTIISFSSGGEMATTVGCDAYGHVYIAGSTNATNGIATPGSFQDTLNTYNSNIFISDTIAGYGVNGFLAQFNANGIRQWGTYYGASTTQCSFNGLTCDRQGNVYVVGITDSAAISSNVVTPGAFQTDFGALPGSNGGGTPQDGLIVKFDSSGNRIWGTYFGAGSESLFAITSDTAANIYVTGFALSPGLSTPGAFIPDPGGWGILAKFNTSGQRLWSTYMRGAGLGLALDRYNHLYLSGVTGFFFDSLISTPGSYMQQALVSGSDFLMQLDPQTGQRNWGTYYSGERTQIAFSNAVACDASGNVFLAGTTASKGLGLGSVYRMATPGSHQDTLNAPSLPVHSETTDLYLAEFDSTGNRKWGTYYGGPQNEGLSGGLYLNTMGLSISDKDGAIYLYGNTQSTTDIATPDAHQTTPGGGWDAFLVKFLPLDITLQAIIEPADTVCSGNIPLWVLVKNQGRMNKYDPLTISYNYTGPVNGSGDTTYNGLLAAGASGTYDLGILNLTQPGSYSFTVYLHYTQDDGDFPNDTLHFNLFVIAPPSADISVYNIGSAFHFSNNNTQPSYSYSWDFGDGQSSTEAGPSHTYNEDNASYTVTLILSNPCGSDTASITIDRGEGTGLQQPEWSNAIVLYPNPARQHLSIKTSQDLQLLTYSIVNEQGKTLMQGTLEQKNTIDLSALAAGHYLIRIKTDKGLVNRQISLLRD